MLEVLCKLPYKIVVPLSVRKSEVLNLSDHQWQALDNAGLVTHDLAPQEFRQALLFKESYPGLSVDDCLCLATTQSHSGILLTGEALLYCVAVEIGLGVCGVHRH